MSYGFDLNVNFYTFVGVGGRDDEMGSLNRDIVYLLYQCVVNLNQNGVD